MYNATFLQIARISLQGREIDYVTKITVEMAVCLISNLEKYLISTHIFMLSPLLRVTLKCLAFKIRSRWIRF